MTRRITDWTYVPLTRFQNLMCNTPDARGTYPRVGVTAPRAESPYGVVTMSVHKLTAGSGYDYLTRQVAALDATEKGHTGFGVVLHRTG